MQRCFAPAWRIQTDHERGQPHLDLLARTALEESFGVVLAEAMALGLPVVAGDGMLVQVADPATPMPMFMPILASLS